MTLFTDIETVPKYNPSNVPDDELSAYESRFSSQIKESNLLPLEHYRQNAALYAEFNKIVSICVGRVDGENIKLKIISGRHEKNILSEFCKIVSANKSIDLVAHNGMDFDFPVLRRRLMINNIPLPEILDVAEKKPWDIRLRDTMIMWSAPQWKYKVSLSVLCHCLGLPNPKREMSGSDVATLFYSMFDGVGVSELPFDSEDAALQKIGQYNSMDVFALMNCYFRMTYHPIFSENQIVYV